MSIKPSQQIKTIAEEISINDAGILAQFSKWELCVIIAAIIKHLDIQHVLEQREKN